MKKTAFILTLCILAGAHSYQQTLSGNQGAANSTLASTLITVPDDQTALKTSCNGKRIYLTKGGDNGIYIKGSSFAYNPGDTLVLKASQNPYSYVSLDYFTKGTDACPVVIINEGGQVLLTNFNGDAISGGFGFTGSRHIKITGTGSSTKYGFKITTPNNRGIGVGIYGRSANFEIDHLEVYNKGSGMWIKHEADCADSLQFPNWVLHDFVLHDNYIHNCTLEGMYLGSTDPNGLRAIICNGKTIYPKPIRLGNFHIYNNIFDSTGRGAIQLSDADSGENEINNNTITNIGYEYNAYQGNGIILGGYTHAYVHDNTIDNTFSTGLYSLGAGLVRISNNTIDHSGMLGGRTSNGMASIMIDTRNTTNPSPGQHNPVMLTFVVKNNKLGKNTDYNIRVYNTYLTFNKDNVICRNTTLTGGDATYYVATTGIVYSTVCGVNRGNDIVGANSGSSDMSVSKNASSYLYPNPAKDVINVRLSEKISGKVQLNIYDEEGRLLQSKSTYKNPGLTLESMNIKSLSQGIYNIQITSLSDKIYLKFIKAQ